MTAETAARIAADVAAQTRSKGGNVTSPAGQLARDMIAATPQGKQPDLKGIANKTGLNVNTVYKLAREAGRYQSPPYRGLTPRIVALADGSRTVGEIAALVDTTDKSVRSIIAQARQRGEKVKVARHVGLGRGALSTPINSLPPEIRAWFRAQIPHGSDAGALVAAFITDAYHEERGG